MNSNGYNTETYQRLTLIRQKLLERGSISTQEISSMFNVSVQTARKYLRDLEAAHQVKRVHGGVVTSSSFFERLRIDIDNKKRLCKAAAQLIESHDTIYIDGGSSYYYLTDYIPSTYSISVFTCSLPIALHIKETTNYKVYVLGGKVNDITFETHSIDTVREAQNYFVDKAFLGISGFTEKEGFTENNAYALALKQQFMKNAKQSTVVAGAKKEGKVALKKAFGFDEIDVFITNKEVHMHLDESIAKQLNIILV